MKLDRRDFVKFAAGGVLGLGTSAAGLRGIHRLNAALASEEVRAPGGQETWALSVCTLCPAGCGLRVRMIGQRAVSVHGNPLHPVNRGGLCPKGAAALQELYHPDRLRAPLRNTGSRGKPRWREISWDEAVATLAAKLRQLRAARRPHALVLIDGQPRSLTGRLLRRFLAAYGSPNYFAALSGLEAVQAAVYFQQGVAAPAAYDLENTRYLLSFGVDLLEGWGAPPAVMRAFGRRRDGEAGRRGKFVQIEPRLSITASRADEWVAIRPGAEAALALGIAYVLITEDLYDAAFVREHTFGFDDWRDPDGRAHTGFRSLVTSEYRLDDVAAMTGVPAETILRLAREFGQNRPALAIGDRQTSTLPGDPYAAMAVHSLNAMAGSIDAPGGVLIQPELPLPGEETPGNHALAPLGASRERLFPGSGIAALPEALLSRQPYAAEAVLLCEADPVFSMPGGGAFRQALEQAPFVASFASFMDETTALADLVLPAATGLERWQASASPPAFPLTVLSLAAPALAPRHRTRNPAEVVLELARRVGGAAAEALPFASLEDYLKQEVNEVFKAQTGSVFSAGIEETWNRLLDRSGWWAPTFSNAEQLWQQMNERGGWYGGAYPYGDWERVLRTPSRRFEFYSQRLADVAARAGDDRLAMPHQPRGDAAPPERPLLLVPVEVLAFSGGTGAHLPYLQQIAAPHLEMAWESWLEIHPQTAKRLGVSDGDLVWVESRRGRVRVRARLYEGARPGVVHLPLGYGRTQGCEWACRGANPLALVEPAADPLAGLPRSTTWVKVYRA